MRRILFRDIQGHQGTITDELDVNYQGRWEGKIEDCIERIDAHYPPEEVYNHLVVELPDEAPIDGVERVDAPHQDGR